MLIKGSLSYQGNGIWDGQLILPSGGVVIEDQYPLDTFFGLK